MSKPDREKLAHLLEHHPDENGQCDLCEAASLCSVVLPHAVALGDRSESSPVLIAAELAAQAIEGIAFAEHIDLDKVLAAVKRRAKDLRTDRESEDTAEGSSGPVHH